MDIQPIPPATAGSENTVLALAEKNNVFIIDWLTFTAHGETVEYLKWLLGLDRPEIPWEYSEKFRNGYPVHIHWNGVTISYGADDAQWYKDASKVRKDMGICVNLSGKGCRTFETYGKGNWNQLFRFLHRDTSVIASQTHKLHYYNITRLDLAYDDHIGLLDMTQLERDTRDRHYVARAKYAEVIWSDDQEDDIQGMTIQIGSDKSEVKVRIYNKAAERGYKDRHWIRCETQLRDKRASAAVEKIHEAGNVGPICAGILRNYLTYRVPTGDSNPSRWPMAPYWDRVLMDMERVALWVSPGEDYNLSKTEYWLCKQYGQAIVVLDQIMDSDYLIEKCRKLYPLDELAPKYKRHLCEVRPQYKPYFDPTYSAPQQPELSSTYALIEETIPFDGDPEFRTVKEWADMPDFEEILEEEQAVMDGFEV